MRGHTLQTDAAPLLGEYLDRLKLAKIGYRFPPDVLDADRAEAFTMIADEIEKVKAEEQEKAAKKRRR